MKMRNMNICLTNDSFPPNIDGVATTVLNYADVIQRKYGNATVIVPHYPEANDNFPYKVVRYPSIDTTKQVGYRTGLPFSNAVLEATRGNDFDIIHSHCPAVSTLVGRLARISANAPLIMTYHTKFDVDIERTVKNKLAQELAIKVFVENISACDEVWTVSKGAGENLRKIGYTGDFRIMPNGVDFPNGRVKDELIDALAQKYEIDRKYPIFLFVGRMVWYKGAGISIDALSKIKKLGKRFTMIFVGNGDDFDEIKKYAKKMDVEKECLFVGAVNDREILRTFFCLADLFLFPSTFDTNGLVVREAAACGLASVLIKGSCAAEDITDGENGFLIEENADDMARMLCYVSENRELAFKVGENASNQIYLSWESAVDNAVKRYEKVAENFKKNPIKRDLKGIEELMAVISRNYDTNQRILESVKEFINSSNNKK